MNIIEFSDGQKGVLDMEFIQKEYQSGRLRDARIMTELFGFRKDSLFKQEKSHSKECPYNFVEWNVTEEDWLLLVKFIKFGNLNNEPIKIRGKQLEKLYRLGHKLGGIPELDIYYKYFHSKTVFNPCKIPDDYNPQSPEQDRLKFYQWACWPSHSAQITNMLNNHNWECTEINYTKGASYFNYYRRLWKRKIEYDGQQDILENTS